jgi:hypothetical protein
MKSIVRRIEALEQRLGPRPLTARDRELIAMIEEGRERVRKSREAQGLPADSDWGLPPHKIHTSKGSQLIIDILNEGRDRARLRSLRDKGISPGRFAGHRRCLMPRGRPFLPGNHFGHGRPEGSRNHKTGLAETLLESHAEALMTQALALAEKGDAPVLRILLSHILPRRQEPLPQIGPLPMGTAEELAQAFAKLMNQVTAGQINLTDAKRIADLLEQRRRILETENLEKRVRDIERKVDEKENDT